MLQNRVNPWGALCAVSDRGQLMGNQGILHNEHNNIVRAWKHKAWVTCLLQFKDIQRPKPFSQGNYSELFFLDEVTAFAAGHRPCNFWALCRFVWNPTPTMAASMRAAGAHDRGVK